MAFSSSLELIGKSIAEKLKVQFAASKLVFYASRKLKGVLKNELNGKKLESLLRPFGHNSIISLRIVKIIKRKNEILSYSQGRCVIVYRYSDKEFWKDLKPAFIEKY